MAAVPDAALFDWDGTLIDSREALLGAWYTATDEVMGRRWPVGPEDVALVFSLPGKQLFPLVADDAEQAVRLGRAWASAYETTGALVTAFAGVVELLTQLREAGIAIAVVTSKARARFEADAERTGVRALIDVAICQEDTTVYKPDPAPVLRALGELGVAPERAVLAGDTPVDVAAATAAGTAVIGVAWGAAGAGPLLEAGAAAVARDPQELGRLVLAASARL